MLFPQALINITMHIQQKHKEIILNDLNYSFDYPNFTYDIVTEKVYVIKLTAHDNYSTFV